MKVLVKRFGKLINCESGGVLILVAFAMVVLLGMGVIAIDVGSLYQTRRQAVSAADAAALAGAQEKIIGGDVTVAVNTYAIIHNGADSAEIVEQTSDTIKVRVEKEAPLWFFPAFAGLLGNSGANSSQVSAEATALIYNPSGVKGLVPIAIKPATREAGKVYDLTAPHTWNEELGSGNFNFVAFCDSNDNCDSGVNTLGDRIRNGYPGLINIGDEIDTEPGKNVAAKFAVDWRAENNPDIIVPVIDDSDYVAGRSDKVTVVGFAAFEIHEYVQEKNQHKIVGTFKKMITVGPQGGQYDPDDWVLSVILIN